jgi:hypothetical protein
LPDELSIDKWPPREIHKHIVARSLLCDEPPVFVGLPVQVILRMPRRIAGTPATERVFDGRVSHIEWKDVPSGSSGVGVEFFYWETAEKAVQQIRGK